MVSTIDTKKAKVLPAYNLAKRKRKRKKKRKTAIHQPNSLERGGATIVPKFLFLLPNPQRMVSDFNYINSRWT